MILGWITAGAAIFTAFLILGVQIIFYYAGRFDAEYKDIIAKIQFILNWKLTKELKLLCTSKFQKGFEVTEEKDWKPIFPETLEDVRFKVEPEVEIYPEYIAEEGSYELITLGELENIKNIVLKLEKWVACIPSGKNRLRDIGKNIIITGIIIFISMFLCAIAPDDVWRMLIAPFALYFITIFGSKIIEGFKEHQKIQDEIEDTYKKVQKKSLWDV